MRIYAYSIIVNIHTTYYFAGIDNNCHINKNVLLASHDDDLLCNCFIYDFAYILNLE